MAQSLAVLNSRGPHY